MGGDAMALTEDDSRRLKFVLATMGLTLAGSIVSAVFKLGWVSALVLNVGTDALILWYIVHYRDGVLGRLFLFGAAAGIVELLTADPWAVHHGGLVYSPHGPFVVDSPLYMPLGWIYVTLQIGYLAIWIAQRWGLTAAILGSGVIGAINIPTYESLAKFADWWIYQGTPMIFHTPYYVILGEALIGLALPLLVVRLPPLKIVLA